MATQRVELVVLWPGSPPRLILDPRAAHVNNGCYAFLGEIQKWFTFHALLCRYTYAHVCSPQSEFKAHITEQNWAKPLLSRDCAVWVLGVSVGNPKSSFSFHFAAPKGCLRSVNEQN